MKKTLLTVAAILIAVLSLKAQTNQDSLKAEKKAKRLSWADGEFKPGTGSVSTELNINPFKGELSLNNSLNQIKFRYFASPGLAWRFGFNVGSTDSTFSSKQIYGPNSGTADLDGSQKSFTIAANFGFEKHFKGTKRLSPYVGVDFGIADRSSSVETTQGSVTTKSKNVWYETVPYVYYSPSTGYQVSTARVATGHGYTSFGVNLITGFDFYMARNFFIGYEFNFGLNAKKYKTPEITVTGQTPTTPGNSNIEFETKNRTTSIGTNLMNGIRIGYVF